MRKVVLESGAEAIDIASRTRRSLQAIVDGQHRGVPDPLFKAPAAYPMKFEFNRDGWIHWPEREDLSVEFMRLLATAQDLVVDCPGASFESGPSRSPTLLDSR